MYFFSQKQKQKQNKTKQKKCMILTEKRLHKFSVHTYISSYKDIYMYNAPSAFDLKDTKRHGNGYRLKGKKTKGEGNQLTRKKVTF